MEEALLDNLKERKSKAVAQIVEEHTAVLLRGALGRGRKVSRELATDPIDQVFEGRFGKANGMWINPPKGPDENALIKETGALIEECLGGLTEDQRSTFHLKEVDHLSTAEVCNVLDISATNLRVLLFRARNKLRECLERKWEDRQ